MSIMSGGALRLLMVMVLCSGLNWMNTMSSLLNNIFSPATLPLSTFLSYHPTPLPYSSTLLSAFNAKTGEFERFMSINAQSGVWVSSESVILLINSGVFYAGIVLVCAGKSRFNLFSPKIKPNPAKKQQKSTKNVGKTSNSRVFVVFSYPIYYVEENKPFVSATSAQRKAQ